MADYRTPDPGARRRGRSRWTGAHVFHSWSAQGALNPLPIAAARGGVTSGIMTGAATLDFSSQLVNTNIGHQHPRVTAGDRGPRRRS